MPPLAAVGGRCGYGSRGRTFYLLTRSAGLAKLVKSFLFNLVTPHTFTRHYSTAHDSQTTAHAAGRSEPRAVEHHRATCAVAGAASLSTGHLSMHVGCTLRPHPKNTDVRQPTPARVSYRTSAVAMPFQSAVQWRPRASCMAMAMREAAEGWRGVMRGAFGCEREGEALGRGTWTEGDDVVSRRRKSGGRAATARPRELAGRGRGGEGGRARVSSRRRWPPSRALQRARSGWHAFRRV